MLISPLDREVTDRYNLTVSAFDRGQPQMSAVNNLVIFVSDENDVIPTFLRVSWDDRISLMQLFIICVVGYLQLLGV